MSFPANEASIYFGDVHGFSIAIFNQMVDQITNFLVLTIQLYQIW